MDYSINTEKYGFMRKAVKNTTQNFNRQQILPNKDYDKNKIGIVDEGLIYLCAENEFFERNILAFFRKGDFFSYDMLLSLPEGISYFISKAPSVVTFFRREDLTGFFRRDEANAAMAEKVISEQVEKKFLAHTFILQQKTVRSKLTNFFRAELSAQDSEKITVPMPFSDLADYLAIDRTALMKELRKMKDEGIIAGKNRTLRLLF